MLHAIILPTSVFSKRIIEAFEAHTFPSEDPTYRVYKNENILFIEVSSEEDIRRVLHSAVDQFAPDTVFFLSSVYGVSDEKIAGDIVLPNVFFEYDPAIEGKELTKENRDLFLKKVLFVEHYDIQNDYDFESFGLSIGGISVSGDRVMDEDFRIALRLAYEADTYAQDTFAFVEESQKMDIGGKAYPIEMITSGDDSSAIEHAIHIIKFLIGSIDGTGGTEEEDIDE